MDTKMGYHAAVVGAGPAGLFAARELSLAGVHVAILNRDLKPGGLAEYGIYPDKHDMKSALRSQFHQTMANDLVSYYGNVNVGLNRDLALGELPGLGFQAVLAAVGAQGTKKLGIPGEDLKGVYHAKDLVYYYNDLPPYSQMKFEIGRHVAVIGMGNVMTDVARYLIEILKVGNVMAVARRGPGEIKFDKKELEHLAPSINVNAIDYEIEQAAPLMKALGEDPEIPKAFIHSTVERVQPGSSDANFMIRFLLSPTRIIGDENGRVCALEVEENTLVKVNDEIKARGTGNTRRLEVDTLIFAIGDRVDDQLGLPLEGSEFVKSPAPRFPVEGISYEAYDPVAGKPIEGLFLAGWSRQASTGLVGMARRDGVRCAGAMLAYLKTLPQVEHSLDALESRLQSLKKPVIRKEDLLKLLEAEEAVAKSRGLKGFKFSTNEEMLKAIGR